MNGPIYKRELLGYFRTPIAYVFIAAFHLAVMISCFFINSLLDTDQADLQPFFGVLPWLLLFLVPGIGMRSWAEENHRRTIELTLTLPCHRPSILLSKFLAAWTVIGLALALTFPLGLTIAYLGNPDWGALLTAYLGGWLMAGSLLAVATLCSVLSRMQVVSFVLSVCSSLALLIVGWGVFSDILRPWLPLVMVDALAYLGIITHYEALARGVLPLQDVLYFVLLGTGALLLADFFLSHRGELGPGFWRQREKGRNHVLGLLGLALAFILNGFVTSRLDLSESQAYSIGPQSLKLAQELGKPVEIQFFFSHSRPEATPFMKQYAFRVRTVLEEYKEAAQGLITLKQIDPEPDSPAEDLAIEAGLKGFAGPTGKLYFGISMKSGEAQAVLPFLDPTREDLLEYEIAKTLLGLSSTKKPRLGIFTSLKMRDYAPDGQTKDWALLDALAGSFSVDLWGVLPDPLPEDLAVLFLVHPKDLDPSAHKRIEAFLQRGGRLLMAVDPFSRIELIQKHGRPQLQAGGSMPTFHSQAAELLKDWGIIFDSTKVVGDARRAANINLFGQSVPHPLFMKLSSEEISQTPFLKNLNEVFIAEGGSLSYDPAKGLEMQPLLKTSDISGQVDSFPLSFKDPAAIISSFRASQSSHVVAALYKGLIGQSEIIVVADVDFLEDRHATRTESRGGQQLKVARNDNLNFVLNSLEYLAGSSRLLGIRTAGVIARPFTVLRDLQRQAEDRWRSEEQKLQDKIKTAKQQLSSFYQRDAAANRLPLRLEDLKVIKQLRLEERDAERRFHRVRVNLREESTRLFHRLMAVNFFLPLALIAFGWLGFALLRFKRWPNLRVHGLYLAMPTSALVLLGSWLIFLEKTEPLRAAPVFDHLFDMEDLAGVERVIITEQGQKASLVKGTDGVWRLAEAGMQPINADRLSRLLYDMSEAKIVRRLTAAQGKSDSYGIDQGRSLAFDGRFRFKMNVGKQQPHGGFLVQVEGQPFPFLIDDFLHTYVSPEFWLATPSAAQP